MSEQWNNCHAEVKPFYYPVEAAIRWCGLVKNEFEILADMDFPRGGIVPKPYPQWPCLRQRTELIIDAMDSGELPQGREGSLPVSGQVASNRRTVRHNDLKEWVAKHSPPSERPPFLFDEIERKTHPTINADAFLALQVDRDALKVERDGLQATLGQARTWSIEIMAEREILIKERDSLRATLDKMGSLPADSGVTVTLPHMTAKLEALFEIMRENWTDCDPRRLPKQVNIATEIDMAMGWSAEKSGTPSRSGRTLAAIIKPDGAPDD